MAPLHITLGRCLPSQVTKLTIDIIGKVVLDHDFKTLTTDNEFVKVLMKSLTWMPDTQSVNIFHRKNPLRPLFWSFYKRKMDQYIGNVLDERFKVRETSAPSNSRKRVGIDLSLEAYFKEKGQDFDAQTGTMDAAFRHNAIENMLTLLFAGYDTTTSTICYSHHMLSKNPEKLARLRQELDDVFGAGVNAADQLTRDPYIINKCEYMLAVIKEVLRLWSPASSVREGNKNYFVRDPVTGKMLPTEGCVGCPRPILRL